MPLPKHRFPTYELFLPGSEKTVKYRPWVSVEHKKLLTALMLKDENQIQEAVIEILDGCTFDLLDIRNLPVVDFELLFISIKAKSKGEKVDLNYTATMDTDGTDDIVPLELDLTEVQITKFPERELFLSGGLGIKMKFPTVALAKLIDQEEDDFSKMARLVEFIFDKDNIYHSDEYTVPEIADWLKGLIDLDIQKIIDFFNNLPTIKLTLEFAVGIPPKTKTIELRGLNNFFL